MPGTSCAGIKTIMLGNIPILRLPMGLLDSPRGKMGIESEVKWRGNDPKNHVMKKLIKNINSENELKI